MADLFGWAGVLILGACWIAGICWLAFAAVAESDAAAGFFAAFLLALGLIVIAAIMEDASDGRTCVDRRVTGYTPVVVGKVTTMQPISVCTMWEDDATGVRTPAQP